VVVVAAPETTGMLRALSLPELLPDFAVWDQSLAPARGQILLGGGSLRAAGFFSPSWALPAKLADPLGNRTSAGNVIEAAAPVTPH
jgi:hypothetical protein